MSLQRELDALYESMTVQIELTHDLDLCMGADCAIANIEDLPWQAYKTIRMTVDNRGIVMRLRRNQRVVWRNMVWYGAFDRDPITLRVWHDGSVSVD